MDLRLATKDDIKFIKDLYWVLDSDAIFFQPEHFIRTERPDDFLLNMINDDKSDFILVEEDNNVIGFSLIMEKETKDISCLKPNTYAYILDFVIDENYRSKGYGRHLMNASKEWGIKRKLSYIRLSVFPDNIRGIKFYKENGLKENMITMEYKL